MAADRLHVLLFPIPFQGHMNPMLHLASHLLSRGCSVTFICTRLSHKCIVRAHRPSHRHQSHLDLHIRYVTISDGLPPDLELTPETALRIVDALQDLQGGLEELIESSKVGNNPISCIISNCLSPWTLDVAKKAGIPGAVLWPTNATILHLFHLRTSGELTGEVLERDHFDLGSLHIDSPKILSGVLAAERNEALYETFAKTSHILLNSFETLEDFLEPTGPVGSKIKYIGPCLPMELVESEPRNEDTSVQESVSSEDLETLIWLDSHAACSVLFISFGSVYSFPPDQIEQIAMGIEESKLKFLWVIRPDGGAKAPIPEGFVDRTKDRGRIIPWAQQLQVLRHPATGGFMTHCGWNSTLESVCMGVPMLCLPVALDQPINGYLAAKQWRVGMVLKKDGDGKVRKEEVERAARSLMEGDEGLALRKRAGELKEASRQTLSEGGLSFRAFETFLEDMKNPKP